MIIRPDYIQAITPFIDQPLVKILAGVRRCGKSTIFEMLAEELRSRGIPDDHIIQKRYTGGYLRSGYVSGADGADSG